MLRITILAVLVSLVFVIAKTGGRTLLRFFGSGFLTFIVMLLLFWLVLGFSYSSLQHHGAKIGTPVKSSTHTVQISTEAMWQHLTRPQIELDEEEPKEKTAKDVELAVAKEPEQTRPAWVDHPPKRVGNVYRVVVSSGPYQTETECYHVLETLLAKEVQQRIEQLVPDSQVSGPDAFGIGVDYVLRELCNGAWTETSEASFGEMKQVHVLMEFGAAQDKLLRTAYRNYQRQGRVAQVGGIAGLILGGLATLFGLLKIDTATKGYYSKRLFFGVPAAIIAILLLLVI